MNMTIKECLEEAGRIVEQANLPEPFREIAYFKAVDLLRI